ncbi:MAG: isopentenyl phosphate kinase [Candidatus Micrarchaeaceae archaeon]
MIVLKIGGSAFSDKSTGKSYIGMVARNVASEIPNGEKVLIVQGAGYIGHSIAMKYGLSRLQRNQRQWALLRYEVERISNQIAKALIDKGMSPFVMSAQQLFKIKGGRAKVYGLDMVEGYINNGFIPIIHSDAPLDDTKGISILSGDDMARILANRLNAGKLIFGTDVDGLIGSSGKIVKRIKKQDARSISITNKKGAIDVSGGMKKKLEQAALAKRGMRVLIINLRKAGELRKAANAKSVGTLIY